MVCPLAEPRSRASSRPMLRSMVFLRLEPRYSWSAAVPRVVGAVPDLVAVRVGVGERMPRASRSWLLYTTGRRI